MSRNPFAHLPHCGAKNRRGKPCKRPAGPKGRCYYHGGAPGSGAPLGNQNALIHGHYTREAIEARQRARELIRQVEDTRHRLEEMEREDPPEPGAPIHGVVC